MYAITIPKAERKPSGKGWAAPRPMYPSSLCDHMYVKEAGLAINKNYPLILCLGILNNVLAAGPLGESKVIVHVDIRAFQFAF